MPSHDVGSGRRRRLALALLALALMPLLLGQQECSISGPPSRIAYEENRAFDFVNQERIANGLPALIPHADLANVARAHSRDMAWRNYFAHVNPDGDGPFDRLAAAGITYRAAGENLAFNNHPNPARVAVNGWMNSPGHRENILFEAFTHAGMGVAYDGNGGYYFTQVFAGW